MEEERAKKIAKRRTTPRHLEQLIKKTRALAGADDPKDVSLEDINKKVASLEQRHLQLQEKLASGSEKLVSTRLRQEFEDAFTEASSTYELSEASWTDDNFELILEGAKPPESSPDARIYNSSKVLYQVNNKVICGLKGGSIGVQYGTLYAGNPCESYYLVLTGSLNSGRLCVSVSEHTIPFFLPFREAAEQYLPSSVTKFIDRIGDLLQAYVSRREQIRALKAQYGPKIRRITNSILCDTADFMMEEQQCKVTVNLTYRVESVVPMEAKVLAYTTVRGLGQVITANPSSSKSRASPLSLTYAEEILKTFLLPEACGKIVAYLSNVFGRASHGDGAVTAAPGD